MSKFDTFTVTYCGEWLDTVHFLAGTTEESVKKSLVEHDGYPASIAVDKIPVRKQA